MQTTTRCVMIAPILGGLLCNQCVINVGFRQLLWQIGTDIPYMYKHALSQERGQTGAIALPEIFKNTFTC